MGRPIPPGLEAALRASAEVPERDLVTELREALGLLLVEHSRDARHGGALLPASCEACRRALALLPRKSNPAVPEVRP